ncbi:MAG: hypothetical protein KY445_08840 [Armatimonadetes bacterium]|nr:hypothetical protein [Armatimonadota bacterium]
MSAMVSWPRSRWVAGGGEARVCLEVCGRFEKQLDLSDPKYGEGLPDGVTAQQFPNDWSRFAGAMGDILRESNLDAAPAIEAAPQFVRVFGHVPDPDSLDYLRDILGVVAALLDQGGVGVIDPQTLQIFAPHQWRETFWGGAFEPTSHVVILLSMEGERVWFHTRGMRVFGRPDISCHAVKPEEVAALEPVFNGLIRMQAAGFIVPEGQMVQGVGLESRLICRQRGSLDDPHFDNVHLELEWETER